MLPLYRRGLMLAVPLLVLVLVGAAMFYARGQGLKSRSSLVFAGMYRDEVEKLLGPPELVLNRPPGKGVLLVWVDPLWQLDVRTDADGRVESIDRVPSNSFWRRTVGRVVPLPK